MPTAEPALVPVTPTAEADCPLCHVKLQAKLRGIRAAETGATFRVDECPRCGLGRTRPVPIDLAPYYDRAYYGNRHGLTARLCRQRRLGFVRRWAGAGDGRALLDYGCGDGDFLGAARTTGWRGAGVERQRPPELPGNVPIVADLDDLTGCGPFACATFWHVLEHLADPVATLNHVRGHLTPDGVVLAAVPNFASWQSRVAGAGWLALDIPRHLGHFTPQALMATFEAAGYVVEALTFGEFEYDLIGWSQSLLNRYLGGRNEFFRAVSGRPDAGPAGGRAVQVGLGLGLTALAVAPTLVESWCGRGGTMVVAAQVRR